MTSVEDLARGLHADPRRVIEVQRHYEALLGAMNGSHVDGEQDALCVFELSL